MKMFNWLLVLALVIGFAASVNANLRPLMLEEQAAIGANYVWTVGVADLTEDTNNTADTVDLTVPAGTAAEFVAYRITQPFVTAEGNQYTTSLTMAIGDSASATRYLAAQQLAYRNVEVPFAWSAAADVARYLYTAEGTMRLTFTPAGDVSVDDFTAGQVEIYLRVLDFVVPRPPATTGD